MVLGSLVGKVLDLKFFFPGSNPVSGKVFLSNLIVSVI